jgi:hypothetical protein
VPPRIAAWCSFPLSGADPEVCGPRRYNDRFLVQSKTRRPVEISPSHPLIREYHRSLAETRAQGVDHESAPEILRFEGAVQKFEQRVPGLGNRKDFGSLAANVIPSLDLAFEKAQCFRIYAVLHHPACRERFAENLKRELPRIESLLYTTGSTPLVDDHPRDKTLLALSITFLLATSHLLSRLTPCPSRGLTTADCFAIVSNVLIYQWFVGGISRNFGP